VAGKTYIGCFRDSADHVVCLMHQDADATAKPSDPEKESKVEVNI
jgi:hypothetical protein